MNSRLLFLLLLAASVAVAQQCPVTTDVATYPNPPLTYPMTSNRYAVQYKLGSGDWTDARVYISYYGGTNSSPYVKASNYPPDTSMSFVSIPASAGTAVALRVTKLWGSPFPAISQVSVRPTAKKLQVDSVSGNTAQISTNTAADFAGEQFVLWWDGDTQQSSTIQGLAFFLDPPYDKPTGRNVKTIAAPADLTGDLSQFDTLDFEGTVAVGSTGAQAFIVPANINTVFLGPGAWVQGKLRFAQSGAGHARRIYGPGVLDVSRFNYMWRQCRNSTVHTDDGYQAVSWVPSGTADSFLFDGLIITDTDYYATDRLSNATVNNMKIIGWNGNNDGLQFGLTARASNVFVRTGDDSLKMWGAYITVTNATVWQGWNGGVVNLGWFDNSPGEDSLIDGLYVVRADWRSPNVPSWTVTTLNASNDAVIASEMVPGTNFGAMFPSVYRNIYVDDTPRTLVSLKIVGSNCGSDSSRSCPVVDLTQPSVLNLNIENFFTPASTFDNSIGFQTVNGTTLTGSMNIVLTNVMLTSPDGTATPLTSANAASVGKMATNGNNINIKYASLADTTTPITSVNTSGDAKEIAQNSWIEIKGVNLVPATTPAGGVFWSDAPEFASGRMPTQLNGVSVTVNGKPAYVWWFCSAATTAACASDQINVLTPLDNTAGTVQVVVNNSAPFVVSKRNLAPAFLHFSEGYIVAQHLDYTLLGPASLYPGSSTPAQSGETILLFATGFGLPSTPLVDGSANQSGSLPSQAICNVGIAQTQAIVSLISPGLYVLGLTVPKGAPSGDNAVMCMYNGYSTPAGSVISVQ